MPAAQATQASAVVWLCVVRQERGLILGAGEGASRHRDSQLLLISQLREAKWEAGEHLYTCSSVYEGKALD